MGYNCIVHLAGLSERALIARGARPAHARALVAWFAGRRSEKPKHAGEFETALPRFEAVHDPDGTVRFAVHLDAKTVVEAVLIEHGTRRTVCVSSQAGCARGCVFCETGRLGLQRNLTAAEIVAQFALVSAHSSSPKPRNVVFMGMGEPLDNLDEVLKAIEVLTERAGFAVPERHITVSTVGIVPKMAELYARTRAQVAVSLHALEHRQALLPVARKWPLEQLRDAIASAPRTVLLQWTLIEGVNDSDAQADALAAFCDGLDVRVNLIPLNPGPIASQHAPSIERCRAFQKRLADQGLRVMLRLPHGRQVGGACGQLRARVSASAR
jgi:23S rRNA (adenine2503-C2)-methyltransferase